MKNRSLTHSYAPFVNQKDTSEWAHMQDVNHFASKISHEVFAKTPAERQELKTRMYRYPNKRHCPVPPNN